MLLIVKDEKWNSDRKMENKRLRKIITGMKMKGRGGSFYHVNDINICQGKPRGGRGSQLKECISGTQSLSWQWVTYTLDNTVHEQTLKQKLLLVLSVRNFYICVPTVGKTLMSLLWYWPSLLICFSFCKLLLIKNLTVGILIKLQWHWHEQIVESHQFWTIIFCMASRACMQTSELLWFTRFITSSLAPSFSTIL